MHYSFFFARLRCTSGRRFFGCFMLCHYETLVGFHAFKRGLLEIYFLPRTYIRWIGRLFQDGNVPVRCSTHPAPLLFGRAKIFGDNLPNLIFFMSYWRTIIQSQLTIVIHYQDVNFGLLFLKAFCSWSHI